MLLHTTYFPHFPHFPVPPQSIPHPLHSLIASTTHIPSAAPYYTHHPHTSSLQVSSLLHHVCTSCITVKFVFISGLFWTTTNLYTQSSLFILTLINSLLFFLLIHNNNILYIIIYTYVKYTLFLLYQLYIAKKKEETQPNYNNYSTINYYIIKYITFFSWTCCVCTYIHLTDTHNYIQHHLVHSY